MKYLKRGENVVADTLSRQANKEEGLQVNVIEWGRGDFVITENEVREAARNDEFYNVILGNEEVQGQLGAKQFSEILLMESN